VEYTRGQPPREMANFDRGLEVTPKTHPKKSSITAGFEPTYECQRSLLAHDKREPSQLRSLMKVRELNERLTRDRACICEEQCVIGMII